MLFVPFFVKALDCVSVTGTGENLGDEVKCGTESFYVFKRDNQKTQLLAKYNLLVGDKIDYLAADSTAPVDGEVDDFLEASQAYCLTYARSKGYNPYYVFPMDDGQGDTIDGCRVYEKIEYEQVRQDKKAIGTFLENGKSKLPLYGITYMEPRWGYEAIHDGVTNNFSYDSDGKFVIDGTYYKEYIDGYKDELSRQKIPVEDVSFPNLSKVLEFLETISGEHIEVNLQYPSNANVDEPEYYIGKMDVKNLLGEKNKWLYSVTYWMGSGYRFENMPNTYNDYYISNEGFLCGLGRGECGYFGYPIGNGIRPVITVSNVHVLNSSEDFTSEEEKENPNTVTGYIVMSSAILIVSLVICLLYYKKAKKAHR